MQKIKDKISAITFTKEEEGVAAVAYFGGMAFRVTLIPTSEYHLKVRFQAATIHEDEMEPAL